MDFAVRRFSNYYRRKPRHWRTDRKRRVRMGRGTLINAIYHWRKGGRTPDAFALNYEDRRVRLSQAQICEFLNTFMEPGICSQITAWRNLACPVVRFEGYRRSLAQTRAGNLHALDLVNRLLRLRRLERFEIGRFAPLADCFSAGLASGLIRELARPGTRTLRAAIARVRAGTDAAGSIGESAWRQRIKRWRRFHRRRLAMLFDLRSRVAAAERRLARLIQRLQTTAETANPPATRQNALQRFGVCQPRARGPRRNGGQDRLVNAPLIFTTTKALSAPNT